MDRRKALKFMGMFVACLGGRSVWAEEKDPSLTFTDDNVISNVFTGPLNYIFDSENIGNIIIERKDKKDLVIPFKEIVKALE